MSFCFSFVLSCIFTLPDRFYNNLKINMLNFLAD